MFGEADAKGEVPTDLLKLDFLGQMGKPKSPRFSSDGLMTSSSQSSRPFANKKIFFKHM
jgi:hypothetical protein